MLDEIFLSLFAVTFLVALVAFSAYAYLLSLLLKNGSSDIRPDSVIGFIVFQWKLLVYYVQRSMAGFFGMSKGQDLEFIKTIDVEIKNVESQRERMLSAYRVFSSAYILFFILLICLFIVFLYMVLGPVI